MQITTEQNRATAAQYADFTALCADYRAFLETHEFPLVADVPTLRTTLQTRLFQKLLAVDKGLKMRWDMLRNDEARLSLITATVDVNGYEVLDEAAERVKALETAYNRVSITNWHKLTNLVPLAKFADVYGLDLQLYLDSITFDWAGREHVLTYFREFGEKLRELRAVFAAMQGLAPEQLRLRGLMEYTGRTYETPENDLQAPEDAVAEIAEILTQKGLLGLVPSR